MIQLQEEMIERERQLEDEERVALPGIERRRRFISSDPNSDQSRNANRFNNEKGRGMSYKEGSRGARWLCLCHLFTGNQNARTTHRVPSASFWPTLGARLPPMLPIIPLLTHAASEGPQKRMMLKGTVPDFAGVPATLGPLRLVA